MSVLFEKALDEEDTVQWGFMFQGIFITNPYVSECGRFKVDPSFYGLSFSDLLKLERLKKELDEELGRA